MRSSSPEKSSFIQSERDADFVRKIQDPVMPTDDEVERHWLAGHVDDGKRPCGAGRFIKVILRYKGESSRGVVADFICCEGWQFPWEAHFYCKKQCTF